MGEIQLPMPQTALAVDLIAPNFSNPNGELIIVDTHGKCVVVPITPSIPLFYGSGYREDCEDDALEPYASYYEEQIYTRVNWGLVVVLNIKGEVAICYYIYPTPDSLTLCMHQLEEGRDKVLEYLKLANEKAQRILAAKKV